jgi:hypothetical protein
MTAKAAPHGVSAQPSLARERSETRSMSGDGRCARAEQRGVWRSQIKFGGKLEPQLAENGGQRQRRHLGRHQCAGEMDERADRAVVVGEVFTTGWIGRCVEVRGRWLRPGEHARRWRGRTAPESSPRAALAAGAPAQQWRRQRRTAAVSWPLAAWAQQTRKRGPSLEQLNLMGRMADLDYSRCDGHHEMVDWLK